ncbi:MAG: hypothetical protein POG24_05440 [Acidocella sp.]|nr:hypothetical protein [Acidocella sp.]
MTWTALEPLSMTDETGAQKIVNEAYDAAVESNAEDNEDREYISCSAILIAGLEAFVAMADRQGRGVPEVDIARGLRGYVLEIATSISYPKEFKVLLESATQSVAHYLSSATIIGTTTDRAAAGIGEPPCDVEASS